MTTTPQNTSDALATWIPLGAAHVLEYKNGCWQEQRTCSLQSLPSSTAQQTSPAVTIGFVSTTQTQSTTETDRLQTSFTSQHNVPRWFWRKSVQNASGYFSGFHSTSSGSEYLTVSHFLIKYATGAGREQGLDKAYGWHKQSFVTSWSAGKNATLLCFDVAPNLRAGLCKLVQALPVADINRHPFALHGNILEHIVSLYDQAIWDFRDLVRKQEKQRPTIENPDPDYVGMHELARHVMHSSEVSETALNVIDSMLEEEQRYQSNQSPPHITFDPASEIRRQRSLLKGMHLRSRALEERLRNEINLAFHISTQADSLIQAKIAAASQRDSNATRTISILGLVFLPGTFISAIFSMSFFNYTQATPSTPASWAVSPQFWIYWVVAIPVTLLTIATWWYWQQKTTIQTNTTASAKIIPAAASRSHIIQIDPVSRQDPKNFTF